ncbi:class I SAM-dependent methyltransferase [Limibacter armeniacum]|uniref:class I SAM-dependent methyltransferase n=1 Tax=Limibacter armeniacum TaxID=466084 RepID=UPI002FE547A9
MDNKEYFEINKKNWNERVQAHMDSDFYDMKAFEAGATSLKEIELDILGDISGKRVLHLQCHFGQDALSLARMGADVTGIDLSDKAIEKAREIASKLNVEAEFVCCNVLEIDQHLTGEYDIIFTTYGVVGWLPELTKWAKLIHQFLKPQGRFLLVEFHPVVWMHDDDFKQIAYSYFNKEAIIETSEGSYADKDTSHNYESVGWNHDLSEVFTALLQAGLQIKLFKEYDFSPYNCFNNTVPAEKGFQIKGLEGKLPMVYAVEATKL